MSVDGTEFATDAELIREFPYFEQPAPVGMALGDRDQWREWAECEFNEAVWGCYLTLGHIYYTAFLIEVAIEIRKVGAGTPPGGTDPNQPDVVGAVTSVKQGPVSVNYTAPSAAKNPSDDFLKTKKSGQMYLHLRDGLGAVPLVLDDIGCDPLIFGGIG